MKLVGGQPYAPAAFTPLQVKSRESCADVWSDGGALRTSLLTSHSGLLLR